MYIFPFFFYVSGIYQLCFLVCSTTTTLSPSVFIVVSSDVIGSIFVIVSLSIASACSFLIFTSYAFLSLFNSPKEKNDDI